MPGSNANLNTSPRPVSRVQATGKGGHKLLLAAGPRNLTVVFRPTMAFAAAIDLTATGVSGYVPRAASVRQSGWGAHLH